MRALLLLHAHQARTCKLDVDVVEPVDAQRQHGAVRRCRRRLKRDRDARALARRQHRRARRHLPGVAVVKQRVVADRLAVLVGERQLLDGRRHALLPHVAGPKVEAQEAALELGLVAGAAHGQLVTRAVDNLCRFGCAVQAGGS